MLSFTSNLRKTKLIFISFFCLFNYSITYSQDIEKQILDSYKSFSEYPKEVVYVHLNKSLFAKNEALGFTAYAFDKSKKSISKLTTNLYCIIKDSDDNIIKSKLIKVENGVASNIFKIDSSFSSGVYHFKAYTNWMLNFKERNYYETTFRVIDNNVELNKTIKESTYNIQVLPESGHIVENLLNTIGVVVKDKNGFGLPFAKGKIIDNNSSVVANFQCNEFGLAKTYFSPKINNSYILKIDNEPNLSIPIKDIKPLGFVMSLKYQKDFVKLNFKTNKNSLSFLKGKKYFLTIHNGADLKIKDFIFPDNESFYQIIKKEILFDGINIFTVFDADKNYPLLERIYFNSSNISGNSISLLKTKRQKDSTFFYLTINKKIDTSKINNMSISILPKENKSYNFNSNIYSQVYLEPYVKGYIENAKYYFSEKTKATEYNLDVLLLTQGWSSYDWKDIFSKPTVKYSFEQGIDIVANLNEDKFKEFITYPLQKSPSNLYKLTSEDDAFIQKGLFPLEGETLKISALKKGVTSKPKLYVQYYPNKIDEIDDLFFKTPYQNNYEIKDDIYNDLTNFWTVNKDVEVLDEIVIKSNKENRRRDSIQRKSFGTIDFFDDMDRNRSYTLASYLVRRGYDARDDSGILTIRDTRPNTINNNTPLLILDDVILQDFSFLGRFTLDMVDYIEINRTGQGYGIRGGAGVIKIKTDPTFILNNSASREQIQSYEFPLSFAKPKKYYTPMYIDLNSTFFKEVGVIDWKPNIKINSDGVLEFTIKNINYKEYSFYIEGVYNSNELISKEIKINIGDTLEK